jgi:hypothetical protein
MKASGKEDATVTVAHHPAGIMAGCAKCRCVIASGKYAIQIAVANHRYLVGPNPPVTCCGEEKKVPLLYDEESSAVRTAIELTDALNRNGDTSNLRLLEMAQIVSTALH